MGGRGIRIRVLGLASTTRGFAFAVLEGPDGLVDWGIRRTAPTRDAMERALRPILRAGQPSLLAIRDVKGSLKRRRGQLFFDVVKDIAEDREIHLNELSKAEIQALSHSERQAKWDVALAMSLSFPEIARRLPPRRKPWQSEDDRIGLFLAVAAGVAAWKRFGLVRDA